jgi:hypothetical protein
MLKNEENQKYRQAIKNVMDFNPEIMKRYVNFMNNPDEETAIAQFGKDDKYFGVCTLMITLPGLPMFGHGQIEGLTEKYGMEYKRAYWDEQEDLYLIERHEREIFPLLKKRYLFSQVKNFILYDLMGHDSGVNEDVFAYSNRAGDERAFVIYNNRYEKSSGWVKYSCASAQKRNGEFVQYTLRDGLGLKAETGFYTIFRDQITGLEFIRNTLQLENEGLYVELNGFNYHVFLDFRQIVDNEYRHYEQLDRYLNGRGVPSIDEALKETFLMPVHDPFRRIISFDIHQLQKAVSHTEVLDDFSHQLKQFVDKIIQYTQSSSDGKELVAALVTKFECLLNLNKIDSYFNLTTSKQLNTSLRFLTATMPSPYILYLWLLIHRLGELHDKNYTAMISLSWLDEFLLAKIIHQSFEKLNIDEYASYRQLLLIRSVIIHPDWLDMSAENPAAAFEALLQNPESGKYLQVNRYQDHLYFNSESLHELSCAFYATAIINLADKAADPKKIAQKINNWYKTIQDNIRLSKEAGYRIDKVFELLG